MVKSILAVLFAALFLTACDGSRSNADEEKIAKIYVDLLVVQDRYGGEVDSLNYYSGKVFEKHAISEKEYLKVLNSYGADEEKWDTLFAKANAYLDSLNLNASFE